MTELIAGMVSLVIGLLAGYYWARFGWLGRLRELREQLEQSQLDNHQRDEDLLEREKTVADLQARLQETNRRLVDEREQGEAKLKQLGETFKALSRDALDQNNETFLKLADQRFATLQTEASGELEKRQQAVEAMVNPLHKLLEKYQQGLQDLETRRVSAYTSLQGQLTELLKSESALQQQTGNLVSALRRSEVRGRWGEMQLRNAVEIAGMSEHCDFSEQVQVNTDGGRLRPDLIVRLPGDRTIVVDSKVPLDAYLTAVETDDSEERARLLKVHAQQCRNHLDSLSKKEYWAQFDTAPDCVIMYIPGESLFSAALEADKELLGYGLQQRVIPATPTTFIALLHAVSYGWQQQKFAQHFEQIQAEAGELYKRIGVFVNYFINVGSSLNKSVEEYNKAAGSLEKRLVVTARRLSEMGVKGDKELPESVPLDISPRALSPSVLAELPHEPDDNEPDGAEAEGNRALGAGERVAEDQL